MSIDFTSPKVIAEICDALPKENKPAVDSMVQALNERIKNVVAKERVASGLLNNMTTKFTIDPELIAAQDAWLKAEALYENAIVRVQRANDELKAATGYFHTMQDGLCKAREALIQTRIKENNNV